MLKSRHQPHYWMARGLLPKTWPTSRENVNIWVLFVCKLRFLGTNQQPELSGIIQVSACSGRILCGCRVCLYRRWRCTCRVFGLFCKCSTRALPVRQNHGSVAARSGRTCSGYSGSAAVKCPGFIRQNGVSISTSQCLLDLILCE